VIEGRLTSRLFVRPSGKSNYEVLRSYATELRAAGFEILSEMAGGRTELAARAVNDKTRNDLTHRPYVLDGRPVAVGDLARVATQADHYLAARKRQGAVDVVVVVAIARSGQYAVEQLGAAAMEEGTVVLTLDALRDQLASEGRVAIYGIHFDTDRATIRSDSSETLATIARYLRENPGQRFYVVGHTDGAGGFDHNLELSRARAEAVVAALAAELPGSEARLLPHGVGPLAPVATNRAAEGRALNRRVELVSTTD
jgi:outer membrane protein OmpA-like peptidoglycan-associated protein